ncbi:MAG: peroxidase family protein, partial [Pseudomonadota bacterium]
HEMGLGWINDFESGKGKHTTTSGFEGAWTPNPIKWDNGYFDVLFGYEWERVKSPAGHVIWHAVDLKDEDHAPEVDGSGEKVPLMMTTADMALRTDPIYEPIARRYHENPEEFAEAFARAWFKLTHRDMGPKILYHGPEVPEEDLIWQDPIPATTTTAGQGDLPALKAAAAECGTPVELVLAAWASASTYRDSDKRGGANGAHVALAPQSGWDVNAGVGDTIAKLDAARAGKGVSLADMIVIGGAAGVEAAAKAGGHEVTVPVSLGRGDATAEQTDADSFAVLEPQADGFRNYAKPGQFRSPEEILVDKAALMTLTAPELTVLVGGMRAMGANADGSDVGVMTDRKGALTPDFFANLLSMDTKWSPAEAAYMYEGADRATGALLWKASSVDLAIGSNSQLRAIAEVYAEAGAEAKFTADFVAAWAKVMDLDRFDLA